MTYRFYIETEGINDDLIEWVGLTLAQAKMLNTLTSKFCVNTNIASYGWEEIK